MKKASCVAVGFVELAQPLTGPWPFSSPPEHVQVFGKDFVRSRRWVFPRRNVVAQYREAVDHQSMHLMVYSDGHFEIDHVDAANPERGHVIEHAMRDVSSTPLGGVVVGLSIVALGSVMAWLIAKLDD
ncbi:MAG TPA: hypothetical protein VK192_06020 [Sphingomicrobium sp.]|nr:hypothetical protein [Sphingomicrobium sp.]